MDNASERSSPRGLARDLDVIKTGGTATAAELREFIGKLRGKRPQEVMGTLAGSGLFRATTLATIGTVVVMAVFTVGPYMWKKSAPVKPPIATVPAVAAPATMIESKPATAAQPAVVPTTAVAKPASPGDPLEPSADDKKRALEKLELGETKVSDPKKNPLENSSDDLLKDLK